MGENKMGCCEKKESGQCMYSADGTVSERHKHRNLTEERDLLKRTAMRMLKTILR